MVALNSVTCFAADFDVIFVKCYPHKTKILGTSKNWGANYSFAIGDLYLKIDTYPSEDKDAPPEIAVSTTSGDGTWRVWTTHKVIMISEAMDDDEVSPY